MNNSDKDLQSQLNSFMQEQYEDIQKDVPPPDPKALPEITEHAAKLKLEIDDMEEELKSKKHILKGYHNDMIRIFQASNITSIKGNGFNFIMTTKESVKLPQTPEDRKAFFDWLKEKNLFDDLITVNSMTLNKTYNTLAEDALKTGDIDFKIPGVTKGDPFSAIQMRTAK